MYGRIINPLIGTVLLSCPSGKGEDVLTCDTDKGVITASCYGDCCSYTWIENIEDSVREYPATVLEVTDIDMPDLGDMEGKDVVKYYGCKITTDKGVIIIDYRNDSNGYYGGSLDW